VIILHHHSTLNLGRCKQQSRTTINCSIRVRVRVRVGVRVRARVRARARARARAGVRVRFRSTPAPKQSGTLRQASAAAPPTAIPIDQHPTSCM